MCAVTTVLLMHQLSAFSFKCETLLSEFTTQKCVFDSKSEKLLVIISQTNTDGKKQTVPKK